MQFPKRLLSLFTPLTMLAIFVLAGCDNGNSATQATPTLAAPPSIAPATPVAQPTLAAATTPTADAAVPPERVTQAKKIIEQMAAGDFATVFSDFDSVMAAQVPVDKLKQGWTQLMTLYGPYKGTGSVQTSTEQNLDVVLIATNFERGTLDTRVVFNSAGKVSGLFFKPSASTASPTPGQGTSTLPAYVDKSKFTERDITVGSGEWALPGTLSMPSGAGPFPAVVLVQGSGPQDRDETVGPNKPFRDLAWGLASKGIAVLRYDKRTKVYAARMAAMPDKVTIQTEVVDDAVSAVTLLQSTTGVDPKRIYVLGHSLGGSLDPLIAKSAPNVAGLVIMAGSPRPFEDLILEQYTYIFGADGTVTADEQKQLDDLKAQIAHVKDPALSLSTPPGDLPFGIAPAYWLSLRAYNASMVVSSLSIPMLIMQGESDYQVTMQDFQGWKDALSQHQNVQFKSYPGLYHPFIKTQGPGKATPAEYQNPGFVANQVISDIATWLEGHQ